MLATGSALCPHKAGDPDFTLHSFIFCIGMNCLRPGVPCDRECLVSSQGGSRPRFLIFACKEITPLRGSSLLLLNPACENTSRAQSQAARGIRSQAARKTTVASGSTTTWQNACKFCHFSSQVLLFLHILNFICNLKILTLYLQPT